MSKLTEEARAYFNCLHPEQTVSNRNLVSLLGRLLAEIENSPIERLERWLQAETGRGCSTGYYEDCPSYNRFWAMNLTYRTEKGELRRIIPRNGESLNTTILAALELAAKQENS